MELTAVQLHPLAALLLVLVPAALVDLVLGELVVDIRLDSGFLPVNAYKWRVVKRVHDGLWWWSLHYIIVFYRWRKV